MARANGCSIGAVVALTLLGYTGASAADGRVDLPIAQAVLPNGDTRYTVPVTVGDGPPITADLDTGSFGLRVLKHALKPDQFEATDIHRRYAFGSGARFDGVLARATVGVGPARTERPILFQLIQDVGCVQRRPRCPASKLTPDAYRIAGDGYAGQGFDAILGISMRRAPAEDSAVNPLTAMGGASWILILPRPGSPEPGHLIIDPDDRDRAGFTSLPLEAQGGGTDAVHGWADGALPGCLVAVETKRRYCGKTLLDSGAPGFSVDTATVRKPTRLGAGVKATFEIQADDVKLTVPFTSGGDWSRHVVLHPPGKPDVARISAGTLPFFSYAVLYDAKAGTMGFKPRD